MADEKRRVTIEEWHAEGRARFGDDVNNWRFVCPSCGFVQTRRDFLAYGVPERDVDRRLAFSCVGRSVLQTCADAAEVVDFAEPHKGYGCNYAGGGLFRINPVEVVYLDGIHEVFDWEPR
jgi:hypothetical protein